VGAAGAADLAGAAWWATAKTDMRAAINAILYLLPTGCPWRYLPRDSFPPRSTVYNIFRRFQRDGVR
jgi:transposase